MGRCCTRRLAKLGSFSSERELVCEIHLKTCGDTISIWSAISENGDRNNGEKFKMYRLGRFAELGSP